MEKNVAKLETINKLANKGIVGGEVKCMNYEFLYKTCNAQGFLKIELVGYYMNYVLIKCKLSPLIRVVYFKIL